MARYLITGIAGFIGSSIAHELIDRGETVRGLDNLSTGTLANLEDIQDLIEFIHGDVRNANTLDLACKDVDYVFHEAAIASVQQSIEDPTGTSSVNLDGTIKLIEAAQNRGVKRIVFASSSAVYGNQGAEPISEDATLAPVSPYAIQKLGCERYLATSWQVSGLETVSLRYFNVFGPGQSAGSPYSGVIATFAQRMISKPDCNSIIYGDGEQSRDFVFIKDVVKANILAMSAPASAVAGKVFNIGSGRSSSVRLAFEIIACITGYTGNPVHVQARPGEIRQSLASTVEAKEALGFKATTSFADGLYQTVNWYKRQLLPDSYVEAPRKKISPTRRRARGVDVVSCDDRHISVDTFVQALSNNELELFYQPILDLKDTQVMGAEALLRWRFGHRLLTPAHFIHLAEQKRLTPLIGAWVMRRACADGAQFQKSIRPGFRIAVNIAASQLSQRNLLHTVEEALSQSALSHSSLDIEVTERTLVEDCPTTQHNLVQLRKRGIRIAVDDFGTGYSNMNYLYRFPIDSLKIDQSFVQHRGHARVLDGIVAFAKTLGVRTVAEGVESEHQLHHVRASGCDEAQGYHIGRPVSASHLAEKVHEFEAPVRQLLEARSRFEALALPATIPNEIGTARH